MTDLHDEIQRRLLGGHDYRTVGRELAIPPGLAYLVATGRPADGSHAGSTAGAQELVNPPAHHPTSSPGVRDWIRDRARVELHAPKGQ